MLDLLLKLPALNYIIVLCVCSVTENSEIAVVITVQTWLACKCIVFAIYVEFQVFYCKMTRFIFLASLKHCMKTWRNIILSHFVNLYHAYLFIPFPLVYVSWVDYCIYLLSSNNEHGNRDFKMMAQQKYWGLNLSKFYWQWRH